jgi:hypothetical protein
MHDQLHHDDVYWFCPQLARRFPHGLHFCFISRNRLVDQHGVHAHGPVLKEEIYGEEEAEPDRLCQ